MYKTKKNFDCEIPACAKATTDKPSPGKPVSLEREERLKNEATAHMAKNLARNLIYYAQLLKQHPLKAK